MQIVGLNIITKYIMGYILPGKPIANVCFKVYGYTSMSQVVSFKSYSKYFNLSMKIQTEQIVVI